MIFLKSLEEIEMMRTANRIVAEILSELRQRVQPGVSTGELDSIAEELIEKKKAKTAFKGYTIRNGSIPFPAHICVSLNNEVVHGIPSLGETGHSVRQLLDTTAAALEAGICQACIGNRLGDVSAAVQEHVERDGFSIVREFVGHGVGRRLHEDPPVPNYGVRNRGVRLREGMVIAIEPMVNMGAPEVAMLEDGWTAVTKDGSLSAHFEHSVAIMADGPVVLSRM